MPKFASNQNAECPHCRTVVQFPYSKTIEDVFAPMKDAEEMRVTIVRCPNCQRLVATIEIGEFERFGSGGVRFRSNSEYVVWPLAYVRPIPAEVPQHIATDYHEAAAVLNLSPKASAALSRRCLQSVLREAGKATQKNLVNQIEFVIPNLPTYIAENIDAIRNIGNFAAHPTKDTVAIKLFRLNQERLSGILMYWTCFSTSTTYNRPWPKKSGRPLIQSCRILESNR